MINVRIDIMASKKFNTEYYAFLAKRIREHDQKAFTELYYATYDDLYRYTFYFIKDGHMAQDALQEVYISIYKNISSLKSDKLFYSWMKQITVISAVIFYGETEESRITRLWELKKSCRFLTRKTGFRTSGIKTSLNNSGYGLMNFLPIPARHLSSDIKTV